MFVLGSSGKRNSTILCNAVIDFICQSVDVENWKSSPERVVVPLVFTASISNNASIILNGNRIKYVGSSAFEEKTPQGVLGIPYSFSYDRTFKKSPRFLHVFSILFIVLMKVK